MKEYRDSAASKAFLSDLKDAHGSGLIVFRNIMHAHPDAHATIKQLVQARSIAKHKPYIPWNTNFWDERLDFSQVIFLGVHTPPIFSTQVQSSKQIVDKTRRALSAIPFDDIVPFVLEAHYGGSSTLREDLFVHPSQSYPRLSAKRVQPDHPTDPKANLDALAPKRKKIHNKTTTVTSNSNNSNSHSQNPNSNNSESNNNECNNTADSQATTGNENATNSLNNNHTHSHNSTASPSLANIGSTNSQTEEGTVAELCDQPFPIRENISVEPFVDGEPYFSRLYDILLSAKKEILICGWQISQIYLKRPYLDNLNSDLFRVLEDASKRGVIVYLMLRNCILEAKQLFLCVATTFFCFCYCFCYWDPPMIHKIKKIYPKFTHKNIKIYTQKYCQFTLKILNIYTKIVFTCVPLSHLQIICYHLKTTNGIYKSSIFLYLL
eukprot:Phypoly_transcript_02111.p1 GENE.Phypoly_transcript_02111~~Phypoly_transcript_02111.p1  ORF type:complete len:488 (+),score=60.07 Phypoly_transcript_02111:158-1465(+)